MVIDVLPMSEAYGMQLDKAGSLGTCQLPGWQYTIDLQNQAKNTGKGRSGRSGGKHWAW